MYHETWYLPAMSIAKGLSALQPVYQPTTLPFSTTGRSYRRPPTSPTGQTDTLRVVRICKRQAQHDCMHAFLVGFFCTWWWKAYTLIIKTRYLKAILAYRFQPSRVSIWKLHVPTHFLWNLQLSSPEAPQFYWKHPIHIIFYNKNFKSHEKTVFVFLFVWVFKALVDLFHLQDYSILAVSLFL